LCTSEHFHFQGSLHHPHQLHPNTLSPQPTSAQLSHSHCHGIFKSVFIKMPLILNVKIILIGPVHIAHQSINLDISAGLATPLPDLCCHWSLSRHCNHLQCFVIQDTQISSFVMDIIKTISLSPRRTIPIISPSPRIFLITQWYTNGKRSLVLSLQPSPPSIFFQPRLCQAAKRDLGSSSQSN
jgi:hypothetical protein